MPLNGRREMRPNGSAGPVFGIGRQVFVNGGGNNRASMVDDNGADVASLGDGAECEVLGWVPRGISTRYFVRSVADQREGWLGVSQLRASREPQNSEAPAKAPAASWVAPRGLVQSEEPKRRRSRKAESA